MQISVWISGVQQRGGRCALKHKRHEYLDTSRNINFRTLRAQM